MNKTLIALAVTGLTLTITACNAPNDNDRTTTIPRMVSAGNAANGPTAGYDAPPAPRDLSPVPPNANDVAPGTDAEAAFANRPNYKDLTPQKEKGDAAEEQHRAVMAQDAAAKAPDTAAADEAKKEVMSGEPTGATAASGTGVPNESTSTQTTNSQPRHGTLTNQSPKEGQVNNYSSTDLEKDSGRPSDGSGSK
jgi:hypothetical protein